MNFKKIEDTIIGRLDGLIDNKILMYGVLFSLSVLTLFFFSFASSPLYPNNYGGDGSFFQIIGDSVLAGKTPYTEIFDHKGPVLFYLEALMQIFAHGKTGIFLGQIVNLFLILILLYQTTLIFTRSSLHHIFSLGSFLLLFILTIHNGNQTEEYSLLHSMVGVYLAIRFYFTDNRHISCWKVVILGLCFSLSFWMRPNNAGMVSACFAFIFLVLLIDRRWTQLWRISLAFFGTIILFSLFIAVHFYYVGALEEMLYATFLFNFRYMGGGQIRLTFAVAFLFISILTAMFVALGGGSYLLYKKNKDKNILLFAACLFLFGILPMCSIRMFDHYLTVPIPAYSVGLMFFFASGAYAKRFNKSLPVLFAIMLLSLIPRVREARWSYALADDYEQVVNEIKSMIPQSEYDQVYAYDLVPAFYVISEIKPYHKYFLAQEFHGVISDRLFQEIDTMFITHPPRWVITEVDADTTTFLSPIITSHIKTAYVEYGRASKEGFDLFLYKLKQ